jgi:hypothetical protein
MSLIMPVAWLIASRRLAWARTMLKLAVVLLGVPLAVQGATISGQLGDPVYLTEPDTLDVKVLKMDGQTVLTSDFIGYGTQAERNAVVSTAIRYWWVTDGQPPFLSRFNGSEWQVLRTDPTWPVATQTLTAAQQITGCSNDRATIRMVYVQGSGGPVTLTSNPQLPAGSDGQVCVLWGASASATLTVADGNGIELDGLSTYTVSTTQSLTLAYSTGTSRWRQIGSSQAAAPGGGGGSGSGLTNGTTLSGLTGASATATNLIPANSWVFGVTVEVTTAITGATGFHVGDATNPTLWGENIAVSLGTTTNIANFLVKTPAYYGAATNVVLTRVGSNFTAGAVAITVYYVTLASLVSGGGGGGGGGGTGLPPGGNSDEVLKRNAANSGTEWAQIQGTANQVNVAFGPGSITLSTPQSLATASSPTWRGQTITQGTLTASTPLTHTAAFNNAGVTFIGKSHNYTDTASAIGSLLERWQVGGVDKIAYRKDGEIKASTVRLGVATITSNYTVAADVAFVMCDAASQAITITLPLAATRQTGSPIWIKKTDGSANYCTVVRAGSDTIEGNTAGIPLQVQYQGHMLVAGGSSLWVRF